MPATRARRAAGSAQGPAARRFTSPRLPSSGSGGRRPAKSPARRAAGWVAMVLIIAVFWPASLGGVFGLTVIAGHSMEPTYTLGQMVVTMRAPSYGLGDVVVYKPDGFGTMVVHRLVAREPDGRFTSQGDNNDAADPWSVRPDQPIGKVVLGLPTCHSRFCQPAFLMRLVPAVVLSIGAMSLTWGVLARGAQEAQGARHARRSESSPDSPGADIGRGGLRGSSRPPGSGRTPRRSASG